MQRFNLRQRVGLAVGALVLLSGGAIGAKLLSQSGGPMERAGRLVAMGDLRGAQVELRNVLRERPSDAEAHLQMAQLHMKLADPVAAQAEFEAAQAAGADRWSVVPLLGEALLAQGLNRETLAEVPPEAPTSGQTVRNLVLRCIAQLALADVSAAEETLRAAKAVAPGSMEIALIGARLAAARGDLADTQAKVAEILSHDPTQIDGLLMQEQIEAAAGHAAKGLEFADRAVRSAPWSAMARMRRANQLLSIGQDDRAQEDVNAVLSVQPRFIEAVYLKGLLMARRGKLEDAGLEMDRLSGVGQRLPQALYYQGLLAAGLGRMETAADFARRYNKLMPGDADGTRLLARVEMALQRPDRAVAALEPVTAGEQANVETLDLLGSAYAMTGDAHAAMQAFQKAVALEPDNAAVLARYGIMQVKAGLGSDAVVTLERSLTLATTGNVEADEALVAALLEKGELDRAEAALVKLKRQAGETEAAGLLEGALRVRRADFEGARAVFASVAKNFPGSIGARLGLASVLAELGQHAAAISVFEEVLAHNPAHERALTSYVTLLVRLGQLPRALQALEAAHVVEPRKLEITAMLADTLTLMHDPRQALSILQASREGARSSAPPLLAALARAQLAAGMDGEAAASYRALLRATPADLTARGQYVAILLRTGDVEGAKISLREALIGAPGDFGVLSNMVGLETATAGVERGLKLAEVLRADPAQLPAAALLKGDLLLRQRLFDQAAQAYLGEYRAAPSEMLLMRVTGAYASAGQMGEADRHLREWLAAKPDTPNVAQVLAQHDIKARRLADAVVHLNAVLSKRPNDPLALNNLAWTYFLQRDERARSVAQTAYLQAPTPDAGDTLGWILVRGGDSKAALPLLQRSGAARPEDPQVQYHLAVALKDEGQHAAAAKILVPIVSGPMAFDDRKAAGELLAELDQN